MIILWELLKSAGRSRGNSREKGMYICSLLLKWQTMKTYFFEMRKKVTLLKNKLQNLIVLRGDVKKSVSFGWCPPQKGQPPKLWSNYRFFVGIIFLLRISRYVEIIDQVWKWNFYLPPPSPTSIRPNTNLDEVAFPRLYDT